GMVPSDVLFRIAYPLRPGFIVRNTINIGTLQELREQLHELLLLLRGERAPVLPHRALRHLFKAKTLQHCLTNLRTALLRLKGFIVHNGQYVIDSLADLIQGFTSISPRNMTESIPLIISASRC